MVLGSGKPKVSNFEVALIVDQQVGGLEVSVQYGFVVAECQPLHQLLHVALDLRVIDVALPSSDCAFS